MTTTVSGLLCWRDFHPLEWQLASLHWSIPRNLGWTPRKTTLACCRDQGWEEARSFFDRQVGGKGAEKAQIEALALERVMRDRSPLPASYSPRALIADHRREDACPAPSPPPC